MELSCRPLCRLQLCLCGWVQVPTLPIHQCRGNVGSNQSQKRLCNRSKRSSPALLALLNAARANVLQRQYMSKKASAHRCSATMARATAAATASAACARTSATAASDSRRAVSTCGMHFFASLLPVPQCPPLIMQRRTAELRGLVPLVVLQGEASDRPRSQHRQLEAHPLPDEDGL